MKKKFILKRITKFSVKMFLLIILCVVLPLCSISIYIRVSFEQVIQKKLSDRIIQDISRNKRNICDSLQKLAYLSNVFVYDDELRTRIASGKYSEYSNTQYFDKLMKQMLINGGYDEAQKARIIIFDQFGRIYSNWSLNYHDYQFLLEQDWVKESQQQGGHAIWSLFTPAYIYEEQNENAKYISLSKAILMDGTSGRNIGTIIISIEQLQFSDLLMEYANNDDIAYVCVNDGNVLFTNDKNQMIDSESVSKAYNLCRNSKSGSIQLDVGGEDYLVSYYTIPRPWVFDDQQIQVFYFTNYSEVTNQMKQITYRMNIVLVVSLCLVIGILYMAVKRLVRPIEELTKQMEHYSMENPVNKLDIERNDEIGRLNRAFCNMSDNIKGFFSKLEQENEIKERYKFESLRAQLNPHFLFNTLTSIRWMAIIRGADNIVENIDALAHMLKYSMSRDNSLVTLREELDNIRNYVYIQNCRYGEHCKLLIEMEETLQNLYTMKFILQPIVENAIIHGYDKEEENITIHIHGLIEDNKLTIIVQDNGIGISEETITKFNIAKQNRIKESKLTGIGLTNVDECIRITYGDEYGLVIDSCENRGTKIKFLLPILYGGDSTDEKGNDSRR